MHTANVRISKHGYRFVVTDCYGHTVENTASMRWALYRYVCAGATGRIAQRAVSSAARSRSGSHRPTRARRRGAGTTSGR